MTIEEYLVLTRKRAGSASYTDESDAFYKQLKHMVEQVGLTDTYIIIINSCKAQCSTVYLNNEKYIIWDLSYWNFIEDYLTSIEIFLDNKYECAHLLYNYLLYRMLRYRVNDKIARKALLELEKKISTNLQTELPQNMNGTHNVKFYLEFLKLFTFMHELNHIRFKEDTEMRTAALADFDEYMKVINEEKHVWFSGKSAYLDIDYSEKINIDEAIKQYRTDDDIKVEILCDYYALDSLVASLDSLEKKLNIKKELFLSDFYCLKEAIIGFYDDVLYYQEYIERLVKQKKVIDRHRTKEAAKGFYNFANLYMARESLFNPLFLVRCHNKYNCVVYAQSSMFYDLYNKLNHKSLKQNYLKDFINSYNDLISKEN